jgi:argininosuccinate lyase
MPQKKNPDLAELIRGKTGHVYGNYIALASTLKSLPLSYNRDLQEDKLPLFNSSFTYEDSLDIMNSMVGSSEFNDKRFLNELKGDFSLSTDLADWLVLKSIPFREAHEIVGKVVQKLEEEDRNFSTVTLKELKDINPVFDESALECLDITKSLEKKKSYGSPNPEIVKSRIEFWKQNLT